MDISQDAANALFNMVPFTRDNTEVREANGAWCLLLHGHPIANLEGGVLCITDAGYPTKTTMARLNALPGVTVYKHRGLLYLNGEEWNGKWKAV